MHVATLHYLSLSCDKVVSLRTVLNSMVISSVYSKSFTGRELFRDISHGIVGSARDTTFIGAMTFSGWWRKSLVELTGNNQDLGSREDKQFRGGSISIMLRECIGLVLTKFPFGDVIPKTPITVFLCNCKQCIQYRKAKENLLCLLKPMIIRAKLLYLLIPIYQIGIYDKASRFLEFLCLSDLQLST